MLYLLEEMFRISYLHYDIHSSHMGDASHCICLNIFNLYFLRKRTWFSVCLCMLFKYKIRRKNNKRHKNEKNILRHHFYYHHVRIICLVRVNYHFYAFMYILCIFLFVYTLYDVETLENISSVFDGYGKSLTQLSRSFYGWGTTGDYCK